MLACGECKDSPWEFFRPVTGIGSNSSSVPASALACWGSKSEIRRDESAGDKRKVLGCWGEKIRKKQCLFLNTFLNIRTILIELAVSEKKQTLEALQWCETCLVL